MEITNEIKAKMFAQYFGQTVMAKGNHLKEEDEPLYGKIYDFPIKGTEFGIMLEDSDVNFYSFGADVKLILKPLSSITDEDAIDLAKITYKNPQAMKWHEIGKCMIADYLHRGFELSIKSYQFLQSRGYDLPHYLLDGKTLIEAGLAIDMNTLNK